MADNYISQVTLPDNQTYDLKDAGAARDNHFHGNILNNGTISTSADIEVGDALVISTSANTGAVIKTTITFDASTTAQILSKAGTWVEMYRIPIEDWSQS